MVMSSSKNGGRKVSGAWQTTLRMVAFFVIAFLFCAASCSFFKPEPYKLMWSADKDADLFIIEAKFDGRVDAAPGFIGGGPDGKLGGGVGTMYMNDRSFPKRGKFRWHDFKTGKAYQGELIYPDNLAEIADDLEPTYTVMRSDKPVKGQRILMTGFSNDHQVIGWLANSGGGPGVIHSDLREVARAQGVEVPAKEAIPERAPPVDGLSQ
jgi:hypothetical protein